jgi:hypothetical protein
MEFARTGLLYKDSIKITMEQESEVFINYSLDNRNISEVQKGHFKVNHEPIPSELELYPAYPNPFNPVTTIQFDIPNSDAAQNIVLSIFDIQGREIKSLVSGHRLPGSYKVRWNAERNSSGMYFARLVSGKAIKTQKIILLK